MTTVADVEGEATARASAFAGTLTAWRSVAFPERYYVSTRPEGRGWTTHDTIIDLTTLHSSGRFYEGSAVPFEVDLR